MTESLPGTGSQCDVYAIPVAGQWLLVSPWAGTVALVNRAAAAAVAGRMRSPDAPLPEHLRALWARLVVDRAQAAAPLPLPEKLVIIPTRACNMRCVYCDFSAAGASGTVLDPRLACRLLDYQAAQWGALTHEPLRVHFFGGEPLVARSCVEATVHYARALCARRGLKPWFELTTNGLFGSDVVPFVGDYFDSVVVSLDGDASLHDASRRRPDGRGTYADIAANIRRLSAYPVEISLRMCVSNRSAEVMADVAERFCQDFEFDILGFEMLTENAAGLAAGLAAPDPYAFAAGVVRAEFLAASRGLRVVHGPSELTSPRGTSCPFGRGTLMLTPEGKLAACYLEPSRGAETGLDFAIGSVDAATGVHVDWQKLETLCRRVQAKPRCDRCFCRTTCAGGCHVDQTPPGCSLEYNDRCRAVRVITAARLARGVGAAQCADLLTGSRDAMALLAENLDDRLTAWPFALPEEHS